MEKKKKLIIAQNIAEPMWAKFMEKNRSGQINYDYFEDLDELITEAKAEDCEVVSIVDNKALLNEINKRTDLGLSVNNGLRAEVKKTDDEQYIIYCVSVTNLVDLYKYAKEDELPVGVNLQVIRYEF